ncbi:MAG: segregation/condensation protein A [Candidatus Uhrbacteria bacterium]
MYQVSLEKFSGPLDLLLSLIEKDELPITEIALAQVTGDYLKYLEKTEVPAEELADFLTVAARLLLIKSNSILPSPIEEIEDPNTLAAQLRLYRAFIEVAKKMESLYLGEAAAFVRPYVPLPVEPGFHPPENLVINSLVEAFWSLVKKLEPFFALRQASLERVASVEERIRDIQRAVMDRARFNFSEMIFGAKNRAEIVTSFLALLELVKQRIIKVQQKKNFEEIELSRID